MQVAEPFLDGGVYPPCLALSSSWLTSRWGVEVVVVDAVPTTGGSSSTAVATCASSGGCGPASSDTRRVEVPAGACLFDPDSGDVVGIQTTTSATRGASTR